MIRFRSIRFRLAVWTAGLLLVALVLFSAFVYLSTSSGLYAALDDSLQLVASQAISTISIRRETIQVGEDFSDFTRGPITAGLAKRGLTIQFFNPDGQPIHSFGPFASIPLGPQELSAIAKGSPLTTTVTDPVNQERVRIYVQPLTANRHGVGAVRVAQSLGELQSTLSNLRLALLIGNPLLILFAGLGGYFLARRALQPIDQIVQSARQISADDLSARLEAPTTQDEVGRLTATLNEMLSRLDESFQREHRFIADASHELRTPVTAIQTILSTTLEKPRSALDYQQALQDLSTVTGRLLRLTQSLLTLAHPDRTPAAARRPVDLSILLENVVDSLRPLADAKGLRLTCSLYPALRLDADEDGLIRLFYNLIDNAIKYSPAGSVAIQAEPSADHCFLVITVADSGIGIPTEHLPHIFDRFYRVDPSRTTTGAGLGLAIAREIVREHQGDIQVSSQAGRGTRFVVRFPILPQVAH
jgi:heavy metal sensor kinase